MIHTFVVYVEDRPGVLNRVVSLFRGRGYHIRSITVGGTEEAGISRMTISVQCDEAGAHRIAALLYKLVNVLRVENVTGHPCVIRDLVLIKVCADHRTRSQVMELVHVFRARVVDVAPESLVIEMTGTEDKIDGLIEVLRPYSVIEMARTGRLAVTRGLRSGPAGIAPEVLAAEQQDGVSYSV